MGLLIGKVSQGQGFYSSHGLVLIPCVVPHDLGGVSSGFSWAGFSLERFVIGKASHGKAFPWQGLPMARPPHGKAFPWQGLPMERPSHWQGFSGARFLFITWACPHPMCCSPSPGGCFLWLLLGWYLIGKVCHWKGFPWEGLPMARPSHGKAFPWQGLPM